VTERSLERREEPGTTGGIAPSSCWIVVLTWNGWHDTSACLTSLRPVVERGFHVLLVDNGSSDGTPRRAPAVLPAVEVIENGENLGFAAGNNVGIRHALGRGAEAVILLNNDTTVAPDFAEELLRAATGRPRVGTATAKIYFHDPPDRIWFAGGTLSTWTGRATHAGYGRRDRGQYDRIREIGRPCACAMLMTRACIEEVGLLEESLFLYGEEIDWALRSRAGGWVDLFAPGARVWHKVSSGTGGEASGKFYYYAVRNMLRTLGVHAPIRSRSVARLRDALVLLTFAFSVLRSRARSVSTLREVLAGYREFKRGVIGPRLSGESG